MPVGPATAGQGIEAAKLLFNLTITAEDRVHLTSEFPPTGATPAINNITHSSAVSMSGSPVHYINNLLQCLFHRVIKYHPATVFVSPGSPIAIFVQLVHQCVPLYRHQSGNLNPGRPSPRPPSRHSLHPHLTSSSHCVATGRPPDPGYEVVSSRPTYHRVQ
jgi:hypothetical protein